MAQISYIKYKDVLEARRYDAEYFKPEYLIINSNLKKLNSKDLDNYCFFIKKGIFDISPTKYKKHGIPFLRVSNTKSFFINDEDMVYLDEETHKENNKTELRKGDIVLSKVGTIGDAVINLDYEKVNFSQNNVGIKIKQDEINSAYVIAFFNSKYGRKQIEKQQSGQVQEKIVLDDIKFLKIPRLNNEELIASKVIESKQKQTQSKQLYREAEELLLAELGLLDYQVIHSLTFSTTKKAIEEAHRYDSEYFQPKYAEIIKKIEKYDSGWDLVKNAIHFKDKNFTPKVDQKYKYLALSNISSQGYIQDYQEEFGKDLPSRARRKINTDDLIISSIEGSLSSCALVEKEFDNSICSTGFFVLNSEKINSETLLILFKSLVIQELLQRGSKGTILTAISKTELESIKIPLIKPSIQKQIAEKIQESHKLRKESKELLDEAKRRVEEEIEK